MSLSAGFTHFLSSLEHSFQRLLIAYSGGVDSTVLLHLAAQYQQQHPQIEVLALHVNHGLQASALQWQSHCQQQAQALGLRFISEAVSIQPTTQCSLEAQARAARYAVFKRHLQPNTLLLTAQHQDDQLETFLLALKRGSGLSGLAAMPALKPLGSGWHGRPLLNAKKAELTAYAQAHALSWEDDPSNLNVDFDRNFLRQQVLPMVSERWPSFVSNSARSVELLQQSLTIIEELAEQDLQGLICPQASLCCEGLLKLSAARQANALRFWLAQQQCLMPSQAQLQQILQQAQAKEDAKPCVSLAGGEVRRYRQQLFLLKSKYKAQPLPQTWLWSQPRLRLEQGGDIAWQARGHLRPPSKHTVVSVSYRHIVGNPSLRVAGRQGSRKLKKLLQEASIAPWLRECVPLLLYDDALVAIGDSYIVADYYVATREEGVSLHWLP